MPPDLRIRPADRSDAPAVLALMDGAIRWMNARGNTEQWGTVPLSERPEGPARIERYTTEQTPYLAELAGVPVGALVLHTGPSPDLPVPPAGEPERYVRLLVTDRDHAGLGIGAALLAHAAEETRRAGIRLLRVDCWAGADGALVAYYQRNGFTPTTAFRAGPEGAWPGRLLERRLTP
ncbi:GNAT family N-acetyltransferase [Streptomyces solincola]|uniref:GNAT family N-acetyltransferase n=1 Tax=Streptomyces solincola TaxID=2100817 RepID=A0A2S9PNH3_9ACTN|nr:GNAT family N-acetyltransferase [Streptomyces solincola]PRH75954.1 GNAT family N-acetyltransferase [Streptomyces solincola]